MTKAIGILFLGGAKRVSMARKFKTAAKARGYEAHLYSYETSGTVAIAVEAEVIIGLKWNDPAIYSHLDEVCRSRGISIVVPFVDGAVAVAAEFARRSGVFAPTGDATLAETMFDKTKANALFEQLHLPVPETFAGDTYDKAMPLIAKPRHGSASKGIVTIDSQQQLDTILPMRDSYLIQHRYDRRRELTVDCYVGVSDGRQICIVPRVRDSVAGGEVTQTTVIHDDSIQTLCMQVLTATGLRGAVTIQLLQDTDSGALMIMEINPRIGGGAVAAVCAGADLPGYVIDEATGLKPRELEDYDDIIVTRYLDETFFKL